MLKFDLTRKYLVGLLTLAMVFSLFTLPVAADVGPIVNAWVGTVEVTPSADTNTASIGATHTVSILTRQGGALADVASGTVWAAVSFGGITTASGLATVKTASTGIYTFTGTYGSGQTFTSTGVWSIVGYVVTSTTNGAIGYADVISASVTKTWVDPTYTLIATPATKTNAVDTPSVLYTHTITLSFKDQLGGTPTPAATTTATWAVTPTSRWGELTGTVTWDGTLSTTTCTYGVTPTHGTFSQGVISVTDIITITGSIAGTKTSTTVQKIWSYTESLTKLVLAPSGETNQINTPHDFIATFYNQYDWKMPLTGVLYWKVTGSNTQAQATVPVSAVDHLDLFYTGSATGLDTISATLSYGTANFTASATKLWVTQSATNVLLRHADSSGTTTIATTVTNTVGEDHYLTATVTDIAGAKVSSATVNFTIVSGHTTLTIPSAITDTNGTATTHYTALTPGTDKIVASVAGGFNSNTVTKIWVGSLPAHEIYLTPETAINSVGDTHQVMALVTDEFGGPLGGETVDFVVSGSHSPTGSAVTLANGVATWSYIATTVGVDHIQASCDGYIVTKDYLLGTIGTITSNIVHKTWVWGPIKIALTPATDVNTPSTPHLMTALVTNEFDVPKPDVLVTFSVTPTGSVNPTTGTDSTGVDGKAYFTFTSTKAQVTTIVASAEGVSATATKTWAALTYVVSFIPVTATNTGLTSHTITITVEDILGEPMASGTVTVSVVGINNVIATCLVTAGTAVFTYTDTYTGMAESPGIKGHDHISVTCKDATNTATGTKTWSYKPLIDLTKTGPDELVKYNLLSQGTHTVTILFKDQYGLSFSATSALLLKVDYDTGLDTGTLTKVFGNATTATYVTTTYTNTWGYGVDLITVTGTIANSNIGTLGYHQTKIWYYDWAVEPADAVNVMGAWHTIYVYGAAGDSYHVTWSTQFGSHEQPILSPDSDPWSSTIPAGGVAAIICKAEWPGKYFFDVTIHMMIDPPDAYAIARGWKGGSYDYPTYITKVAKSWAQLTGFDIDPTLEINPVTQVPTWDTHTITVTVLGEYPVKYSLTLPNIDPPLGGTYILNNGILWVIDAPLAGVPVGWDVRWNLTKNGLIDIWADRVGDAAYLPGNPDLYPTTRAAYRHQDGSALTPIHDLWATSISDEYGEASLTYHMEYSATATWGTGATRTCTWYWPCFVDSITATADYPEEALTLEFGYITGTATKEWRDHAFKLIKYNGHLPIGSNDYIPGAKFFLRRMDLVGTPTYVPPMHAGAGWSPAYAPVTQPPGNAYIVNPADPPGVVTTDTYGEALWMHMPYGVYGLYEYSVPAPFTVAAGKLFEFTINATAPYWCGPDPKITVHYEANTPTSPHFYKITYCGTKMVGVTFEVTNLDTDETISYLTDLNGRLQIDINDFTPAYDTTFGTYYMVHEVSNAVLTSYGVYAVPDFYFYIDETGTWDNTFEDYGGTHVWPVTTLPWAWDPTTPRHWVIDPKIGTEPVLPIEITLDLLEGWNLVGVPLVTNDIIAHLFGPEFNRAFAWDPTLPGPSGGVGSYFNVSNDAPVPGAGFWVKMDADDEVTMEGMAVGSPVAIDLYEGWNIVVNPFETAIDWDTVELGGEPIADTTAMAFSFDGTMYHMADFATDSMELGQGFWLSLDADATIVFTR